jgi:hypothetical protein
MFTFPPTISVRASRDAETWNQSNKRIAREKKMSKIKGVIFGMEKVPQREGRRRA